MAQISRDKALKAAVIPSHARVVRDWPRILNALDRYGYLAVRLRYDIDPRSLISDFKELPKRTVEALACADVIWAGELNGKTIASLLEDLREEDFRRVVRCFFADATEMQVSETGDEPLNNVSQTISDDVETQQEVDDCAFEAMGSLVVEEEQTSEQKLETLLTDHCRMVPSDIAILVTYVLNRRKIRNDELTQHAVTLAKDAEWCACVLKLEGPLLIEVQNEEERQVYSDMYSTFSSMHGSFLLNAHSQWVDVSALARWALSAGVPYDRISPLLKLGAQEYPPEEDPVVAEEEPHAESRVDDQQDEITAQVEELNSAEEEAASGDESPNPDAYAFCQVSKTAAELTQRRFIFTNRVYRIAIKNSHYDVRDWESCRKKFIDYVLCCRMKYVEKLHEDPNWIEKSRERMGNLYPAIAKKDGVADDQKPALNTLLMIITLCDVAEMSPDDVILTCLVEDDEPGNFESPKQVTEFDELKNDIIANYASGFDFKDTSRRLIESRLGKSISEATIEDLRYQMFERSDGLWFLPEMIMDEASLKLMTLRSDELLQNEGCFALASLRGEFESAIRNISDDLDFKEFFKEFIANKSGGKIRGHKQWRTCFREDISDDDGWLAITERVRDVLLSAGDAISINDIVAGLPHLNRDVVLRVCQEHLKDVVIFVADEIEYAKLMEAYYLPDDFGETLSSFVAETEANQGVVSIVLLESELNSKYGDGFRVNYGLEDDIVFKQVVSKSFANDGHVWKKDMFVSNAKRQESNVAEVFSQTRDGMFHEEEFFRFALESRGMTNRGMLILTFLRRHCVRLSKEWWISRSAFEKKCNLTEAQYIEIGNALNNALGNNHYVSIASIERGVYEALPNVEIDGKSLEWNPYLLTSLSVFKVRNAKVINDEPSPYTVTAIVVPPRLENIKDVVEYVLGACPLGRFKNADTAFEYLKMNNIRLTRTDKLIQKINEILKGC